MIPRNVGERRRRRPAGHHLFQILQRRRTARRVLIGIPQFQRVVMMDPKIRRWLAILDASGALAGAGRLLDAGCITPQFISTPTVHHAESDKQDDQHSGHSHDGYDYGKGVFIRSLDRRIVFVSVFRIRIRVQLRFRWLGPSRIACRSKNSQKLPESNKKKKNRPGSSENRIIFYPTKNSLKTFEKFSAATISDHNLCR